MSSQAGNIAVPQNATRPFISIVRLERQGESIGKSKEKDEDEPRVRLGYLLLGTPAEAQHLHGLHCCSHDVLGTRLSANLRDQRGWENDYFREVYSWGEVYVHWMETCHARPGANNSVD